MNEAQMNKLTEAVTAVFEKEAGSYSDFDVKVREYGGDVVVEVSQMYEHLPLQFSHMEKLAEVFGTKDYVVNNWSHGGCETCDYGSKYAHEFRIPSSAVKAGLATLGV